MSQIVNKLQYCNTLLSADISSGSMGITKRNKKRKDNNKIVLPPHPQGLPLWPPEPAPGLHPAHPAHIHSPCCPVLQGLLSRPFLGKPLPSRRHWWLLADPAEIRLPSRLTSSAPGVLSTGISQESGSIRFHTLHSLTGALLGILDPVWFWGCLLSGRRSPEFTPLAGLENKGPLPPGQPQAG